MLGSHEQALTVLSYNVALLTQAVHTRDMARVVATPLPSESQPRVHPWSPESHTPAIPIHSMGTL